MVKVTGVHHIVLKVKDPKKSADFYVKACGMKIFSEEGGAYGLSGAGLDSLWLSPPNNSEGAVPFNRRGNVGLDHWAFSVASMEDLKEIEQHLKHGGIEMEDGGVTDDGYGGTAIFTQDPDGMPLEFHLIGNNEK
ncbi:MAG: VOC family protein [Candidatus Blackburnbacteria bacterium]|nr:VOC family protein [Candidatus Blackburnbacteria bacterium]